MAKTIDVVRTLCVTAIVSLLAQSVLAATPVAVWDGFKNLTPATGYEIVAGDGVVGEDGVATIADGKVLTLEKNIGTKFTIVMEVSDIPGAAGSNFSTIMDMNLNGYHLSLDSQEGALMNKWNHGGDWGSTANATPISGRNVLAYVYNGGDKVGEDIYINGQNVLHGGAFSQNTAITKLMIGGYIGNPPTCTANGMKVYRLAIYDSVLSADEVAEIKCSRSAAAGETYVCSNLDRAETKSSHYTQSANVNFMLPVTGDYPAGTVVSVTTIKLGSPTGKSMANTVTLAGQTGTKGAAETSTTTGYTYVQPYTFSPAVEIEVGKTYTFNANGSQCTGIRGFSAIPGNNMASYNIYSSVEGMVKSIIRKGTISGDCTIATATWANGAPLDGDLVELNVTSDATLTLDSTVNYAYLKITGEGALKISDLTKLGSTPIIGDGTIVIDKNNATITASNTSTGAYSWGLVGLDDAAKWTGTVWLKNVTWKCFHFATLGNANSTVRLTNVKGYAPNSHTLRFDGTLDLVDEDTNAALSITDSYASTYKVKTLTGDGTFASINGQASKSNYVFEDATTFNGAFNLTNANRCVTLGNYTGETPFVDADKGCIVIPEGATAHMAADKTWTFSSGKGIKGAGRIIIEGNAPTEFTTDPAITLDSSWTGTVELKNMIKNTAQENNWGVIQLNKYGNANSTVAFNNVTMTAYAVGNSNNGNTAENNVGAYEVMAGGWNLRHGALSSTDMYRGDLKGSGTINVTAYGSTHGQIVFCGDPFGFTGTIVHGTGNAVKRVLFLAEKTAAVPATSTDYKTIAIGDGATLPPMTTSSPIKFGTSVVVKVAEEPPAIVGTKILSNTASSETKINTQVKAVVVGIEQDNYSLYQKEDGIYLVKLEQLTWIGEDGASITDEDSWEGAFFAEDAETGLLSFSATAETKTINVPTDATNVGVVSIAAGGKYKFVGQGQSWKIAVLNAVGAEVVFENLKVDIGATDITDDAAMKALVGVGAKVAIPHAAISFTAGNTYSFMAGLTLKLADRPAFNEQATIEVENIGSLEDGAYDLVSWGGKVPSGSRGYGRVGVNLGAPKAGYDAKIYFQVHKLALLVRDPAHIARKPLTIWPFGDSITEGMNGNQTHANYRIQLYQKLALLGYNVKSTGFSVRTYNQRGAYDPSGKDICEEEDWIRHSGVGGELACHYTSNHGTLHDSWANALDQAGNPDIVLIHIGINDIVSGDANAAKRWVETFGSVTNMAANILRERPNTKVVLSSMHRLEWGQTYQTASNNGNGNYVKPFRDAMVALMEKINGEGVEGFPKGRVFFADMYDKVRPRSFADFQPGENEENGLFEGDHIHPNWEGHDRMSDCWLEQVLAAFPDPTDDSLYHSNATPEEVPTEKLGAKANVPAEYLTGFTKATVITPAADGKERVGTIAVDQILDGTKTIEKVGYYAEYVFPSATTNIHRWVWVDMDPFKENMTVADAGLPTAGTTQKVVSKLHVASNHLAIHPVAADNDAVTGFIEFSPYDFDGNGGVAGAPAHQMTTSWNDKFNTTPYGSMQIHRVAPGTNPYDGTVPPAEVLFAYNAWNCADENPTEFGIGDFNQHYFNFSTDWKHMRETETMHAGKLQAKSIEVWVKVDAVTIAIPAAPTGAEVEVTVDGEVVEIVDGSIEAAPGAEIEVAYFAARDYDMDDVVFTFVAGEESTIDISQVVPVPKAYVAQIGTDGKKYETLQAAIDATEDGDTVYLIADTIETISTQFAAANITLHINEGVTLTGKDWYTIFNYRKTLTIEGEGSIVNAVNPSYSTAFYNTEGTLYVRGGTIETLRYIFQESSPVKTEVTGGKFNLNPRPWLANKYTTTKSSDGKYFVVEALTYVAKIDTTEYETLQEAIDAVTEGQMIELACSTTEEITFDKNFIVAIKSDGYNYGTITGAKGLWERWNGQYSNVALYVVISKSMEELVEHVTNNIAKYPGTHGRFYIYEDWTLAQNVTIPTVNDLSQSIFPVQNTFVLDLNGHTLDQAPVKSTHGGYPTIVAGHDTKVTIKDSSTDQTGILCGIGWAVDVYDNPNTSVTLKSGTITTHGAEIKNSTDYHGRVIRLNGGSFIMNGGRITLEHLEAGKKIFGVITANTAVASTPHIEINGGYVQCATKDQLVSTNDPNCLIGGSKGPDSEVEITGGSFSIVPPKTYFAEGLDAVVDENGHFHIQEVIHEGEDVTIAVSGDGEKLAPAVPEEGSVEIIAPDETKVYVIDIAKQEAPAALYQVVTKDADGEVVSTSNIGVVKVQEAVSVKNTIAVAVPFTGATVANLLNTALLNENDTLTAYVDGKYEMWTLDKNKKWAYSKITRVGGDQGEEPDENTSLVRGQAVWVTTAGQVVVLGTYDDSTEIAKADEAVNLLANPTMEDYEVPISDVDTEVFNVGDLSAVYKVVKDSQTQEDVWQCTESVTTIKNGVPMTKPVVTIKAPSIKVGKGYWLRKAKESK